MYLVKLTSGVNTLKNTRISGDIIRERPIEIPYENTVGDLLNTYKNCDMENAEIHIYIGLK